jgi:hypothetical protein
LSSWVYSDWLQLEDKDASFFVKEFPGSLAKTFPQQKLAMSPRESLAGLRCVEPWPDPPLGDRRQADAARVSPNATITTRR